MSAASSINPNVNSSSFKQGLTIASKSVSDAEGMRKISQFATALISLVGEILIEVPTGLSEFAKRLEDSCKVLSFFNFLSHIKWWLCEERKSWQHTVSMASYTASQALDAAKFLEKIKAIDLSAISVTIGRIPVLGVISGGLSGIACGFGAWHDGKKIYDLNKEIVAKRDELNAAEKDLEACKAACQSSAKSKKELPHALRVYVLHEESEQIKRTFKENSNEKIKEFAVKKLEHRVKKLDVEISNHELEKNKATISLIGNIASVAFDILIIIGLCACIGALAVTGWPMLVLALVVAGIGLYEFLYDKQHEKKIVPVMDDTLVVAVEASVKARAVFAGVT